MNKQLTIDDYMQMPWHYCTKATQWENEQGFWIAVAELPDCSTFANSIEEGLSLIPSLLKEYLRVAIKSNTHIPLPEQDTDTNVSAGKLLVRIPLSLHMGIKNAAKREHVSINQFALQALSEAVTKAAKPMPDYATASSFGHLSESPTAAKKLRGTANKLTQKTYYRKKDN